MGKRLGRHRKKIREQQRKEAAEHRAWQEKWAKQRKEDDARRRVQEERAREVAEARHEETKALTDKLTEMGFPFHAGFNGHHFYISSYATVTNETLVKLIEALTPKVEA